VRPASGLQGAVLPSYDDHRIAMAWAVLGLGVDGVVVEDVATTRKTVPDFVGSWTAMLDAAPPAA
jgi:3-phosphoshikimate 1-carboxyvinyltransferase